jgi:hypothetical protein
MAALAAAVASMCRAGRLRTSCCLAFLKQDPLILLPIIAASGAVSILPYAVLAYLSGFVGVMIAPTHLCLVLSNTYFKAKPATVYRFLALPCGLLLTASILYFLLIRTWWS